jgi:Leucine-rich repeat (LRR) protein
VLTSDTFKQLPNLEEIVLNFNDIRSIDSNSFQYNTLLKEISLADNKIATIDPKSFDHLRNLEFIDLRDNECANVFLRDIQNKKNFLNSIYNCIEVPRNDNREIPIISGQNFQPSIPNEYQTKQPKTEIVTTSTTPAPENPFVYTERPIPLTCDCSPHEQEVVDLKKYLQNNLRAMRSLIQRNRFEDVIHRIDEMERLIFKDNEEFGDGLLDVRIDNRPKPFKTLVFSQ